MIVAVLLKGVLEGQSSDNGMYRECMKMKMQSDRHTSASTKKGQRRCFRNGVCTLGWVRNNIWPIFMDSCCQAI